MVRSLLALIPFLLAFLTSWSQTGPGGVSSTNLKIWIDASQLGLANGESVSTWTDISGNGNDFSGFAGVTYLTNEVNGLPAIDFNGTSSYFQQNSVSDFDNATQLSIFQVVSGDVSGQVGAFTSGAFLGTNNSNKWISRITNGSFSNLARISSSYASQSTSYVAGYNCLSFTWDMGTGDLKSYLNNSNFGSSSSATSTNGANNRIVLGKNASNSSGYLDGKIAEVLIFNTALNNTQSVIVNNYLGAKYLLTLTSDKYAFDATHGNEVAGIGQTSATDNHTSAQGASILLIENPTDLDDGEYAMWGHDNGGTGNNTANFTGGDTLEYNTVWRWDETGGDLGSVDLTFDMNGIGFADNPDNYILMRSTDGDFSVVDGTGEVLDDTPSINGNEITFTADLTDGDYFTILYADLTSDCNFIIFGSGDWEDSGLWDGSCTSGNVGPTTDFDVTVASLNFGGAAQIDINSNASANNLTISNNVDLVVTAGNSLLIQGDLTIEAGSSLSCEDNASITFKSVSGIQTITNNSDSSILFYDVDFENPDGVVLNGIASLKAHLDINDGDVTINDTLVFLSSTDGMSSLRNIQSGSNMTGNIRVQRWRDATPSAGWADIGPSVVGTTISDLDEEMDISGVSGADGYAASNSGGGFVSLWTFDNTGGGWQAVDHVNNNMENGVGYEMWIASNLTSWNGGRWTLSGTIDLEDAAQQTLEIETGTDGGWNFLSNPYPAYINTSNLLSTLDPAFQEFWVVQSVDNNFQSQIAGSLMPPGQGFYVFTNGDNTDLTIDPSNDFENSTSVMLYKNEYTPKEELRVFIKNNDSERAYSSNIFLRKNNFGFAGNDRFDIPSLRLPDPNNCYIAFDQESKESMVNYVSTFADQIELPIKAESGMDASFTMTFDGLEEFYEYQCINLVNHETGEQIPLTSESSYRFEMKENEPINMSLILSREDHEDCLAPISYGDGIVQVSTMGKIVMADFHLDQNANAEIKLYSITGSEILTRNATVGYSREMFNLESVDAGVYLISVTVNGETQTEKIILP